MSDVVYVETIVEPVTGSLAVHSDHYEQGKSVTIYAVDAQGNKAQPYYTEVRRWQDANGQTFYAAWFPTLPSGNYITYSPGTDWYEPKRVTVFPKTQANTNYR